MNLRDVLAIRLRELMDSRPDLDTQMKVHQRAKVSQSTVGRTLNRTAAATVDLLEDFARAFGIDPVQLLIADNQNAAIYRTLASLNQEEKAQLMGYLRVVTSDAMRHHGPVQLNFDTASVVPPSLHAATQRASGRAPLASDATLEENGPRGKTVTHGKRGKRA